MVDRSADPSVGAALKTTCLTGTSPAQAWTAAILALGAILSCGSQVPSASTEVAIGRVSLVAYLDENRNGTMHPLENVRIPDAEIALGPSSGTTNSLWADMAHAEGAVLVDLHEAFVSAPFSPTQLFVDSLHPTSVGYSLLARTWFKGVSKRR